MREPRHGGPGVAEVERERVEAIRRRLESPARYIEYQMHAGRALFERMRRWLEPRGARVLEVGCGAGGIIMALAGEGVRAHAIDKQQYDSPLPAASEFARDHGLPVSFGRADAARLPYRDASFEAVVASSVIEHLEDPATALSEIARVLGRGGLAFVDFPLFLGPFGGHIDDVVATPWFHLLPERTVSARLRARGATRELEIYRSLNRITLRAFRRMVRDSGLRIAEFRRIHFLTHPGRQLIVSLLDAVRRRSVGAAARALGAVPHDFSAAEGFAFPLLLALVPLSYLPGIEEWATTGVRVVLRRR